MIPTPIAIYGADSSARELAWCAETTFHRVVAYVDDDAAMHDQCVGDVPIVPLSARPCVQIAIAAESPAVRRALVERAEAAGYTVVGVWHASALLAPSARHGDGLTLGAGSIVSADCVLGSHVRVGMGAIVQHGARIGDFATISAGAVVSADVPAGAVVAGVPAS